MSDFWNRKAQARAAAEVRAREKAKAEAHGARRVSLFGLSFALPLVIWQLLFFVFPMAFLIALSFWLVKNYRMVPDFETVNWVKMYSRRAISGMPSASP